MAKKSYAVAEEGMEWAASSLGHPVEVGETYKFELDSKQETALVAAGWLTEPEQKKGDKD